MKITPVRIGMDTAKSVFQLHGVAADEGSIGDGGRIVR